MKLIAIIERECCDRLEQGTSDRLGRSIPSIPIALGFFLFNDGHSPTVWSRQRRRLLFHHVSRRLRDSARSRRMVYEKQPGPLEECDNFVEPTSFQERGPMGNIALVRSPDDADARPSISRFLQASSLLENGQARFTVMEVLLLACRTAKFARDQTIPSLSTLHMHLLHRSCSCRSGARG